MATPFHIVAINPPAKRVGKSKGSKMARRSRRSSRRRRVKVVGRKFGRRAKRAAGRGGKKFFGMSMPIVETGIGSAAGILVTNYGAGLALEKLGKDKAPSHWTQQWWGRAGVKVGAAVAASIIAGKIVPRMKTTILAGGLASAALTIVRKFVPSQFETRWGLAGDDSADTIAGNGVSAELAALGCGQSLYGTVDTDDLFDGSFELNGYQDSSGIYAQFRN